MRDDVAAWVRRSTAAQGLPEKVEDEAVICDVVAALLCADGEQDRAAS